MGVFKVAPLASIFHHTAGTRICCTSSCPRKRWATTTTVPEQPPKCYPPPEATNQATARTTHRD